MTDRKQLQTLLVSIESRMRTLGNSAFRVSDDDKVFIQDAMTLYDIGKIYNTFYNWSEEHKKAVDLEDLRSFFMSWLNRHSPEQPSAKKEHTVSIASAATFMHDLRLSLPHITA